MINNEWIHIPGGEFIFRVRHRIMEGDCQVDHGPLVARIEDFDMLKYPVTNGMFRVFLDETGYAPEDDRNFLKHFDGAPDDHPVTWVSLNDAKAYARWMGGALPTDREWQYAAGGPERTRWPWGNDYDGSRLNAGDNGLTNVDRYPAGASAWGLMDLIGNAWEWVDGPIDDGRHAFALIRGGCYYRAQHFWHIAGGPHPVNSHEKVPLLNEALNRAATVGFRIIRRAVQS